MAIFLMTLQKLHKQGPHVSSIFLFIITRKKHTHTHEIERERDDNQMTTTRIWEQMKSIILKLGTGQMAHRLRPEAGLRPLIQLSASSGI